MALVDTWSNSLKDCKMSERKTLPTNIAEALTEMVTHQQRVTPLVTDSRTYVFMYSL